MPETAFIQLYSHKDFGLAVRRSSGKHEWQFTVTYQDCELLTNGKPHRCYSYSRAADMLECAEHWFSLTNIGVYQGDIAMIPQQGRAIMAHDEAALKAIGYH